MHYLTDILSIVLNLNSYLSELTQQYGNWIYAILFIVIFCETGILFMSFLPGDSFLFAVGAIAAQSDMNLYGLMGLLSTAAVLGNIVNYWIGHYLGDWLLHRRASFLFNRKHYERTHAFFETYGAKTIVIARFLPIIRAFAPFIAGMGKMNHHRFVIYNLIGALLWVVLLLSASYCFGQVDWVKTHFSFIALGIIIVSLIPVVIGYVQVKREPAKID